MAHFLIKVKGDELPVEAKKMEFNGHTVQYTGYGLMGWIPITEIVEIKPTLSDGEPM